METAARSIAESFGISEAKAAALLRRAPGPLTKGIDEREAVRVAYRLRKLGLAVEVRPVDAEPVATAVGRAERPSGSGSDASGPSASSAGSKAASASAADPAGTSSARRSPFLSQVDEAPPPIPGVDAMPPGGPPERRHRDRREGTSNGRAAPSRRARSHGESHRPGAASSESRGAAEPRAEAYRADAYRAEAARPEATQPEGLRAGEPLPEPQPRSHHAPSAPAEPDRVAAPEEAATTGGFRSAENASPTASGSWRASEPYRTGDRPAPGAGPVGSVGSPLGRRLLAAAVLPGLLSLGAVGATGLLVPEPSFAVALGFGVLVLALAAGWFWATGRSLVREHDRVMAETLRISRGDLARPVHASDRYPEAVQALERIRVSLQEGLDRLRRRKR